MKNKSFAHLYILIAALAIAGCTKNETKIFSDGEDKGLAIFSNTQNNIMTCYVAGEPWTTRNRITSTYIFGSGTTYEVYINKYTTNSLFDTLTISWEGHFSDKTNDLPGIITFTLPVQKNFDYKSFSALRGTRLYLDSTNGFFTSSIQGFNKSHTKGTGSIFFLSTRLNAGSSGFLEGEMSGLFEVSFENESITRGRFDHSLNGENTRIF